MWDATFVMTTLHVMMNKCRELRDVRLMGLGFAGNAQAKRNLCGLENPSASTKPTQ